ncbi:MAG: acyltransferase family protein [Clostridia bacterium]|nr:acyltransferase family protein [Clostridia bacterium]
MDNNATKNNTRIYAFDVMRIIAICAVVMLHISADYVKDFQNNTIDFVCGNLLNSISRFAVPMFFMISGALMLNENKKITTRKILYSVSNIFILLVAWSGLYSVAYNVIKPIIFNESISMSAIMYSFFNGHYHLWYLFVLIGLYLATPILRTFIKRDNSRLIGIYLVLSIIVCFCGSFINEFINLFVSKDNLLLDYLSNYRLDYIYEYIIYYILGWYILNVEIKKTNRIFLYISGLFGLFTTFVCTQVFFNSSVSVNNYFYSNDSLNVFLYSIAIFSLISYLFKKNTFPSNRFVLSLSNLTFGVYLIHPVFLFGLKIICKGINSSLFEIIVIFLGAIIASFVSVYIISKIPVLRKLIRR